MQKKVWCLVQLKLNDRHGKAEEPNVLLRSISSSIDWGPDTTRRSNCALAGTSRMANRIFGFYPRRVGYLEWRRCANCSALFRANGQPMYVPMTLAERNYLENSVSGVRIWSMHTLQYVLFELLPKCYISRALLATINVKKCYLPIRFFSFNVKHHSIYICLATVSQGCNSFFSSFL